MVKVCAATTVHTRLMTQQYSSTSDTSNCGIAACAVIQLRSHPNKPEERGDMGLLSFLSSSILDFSTVYLPVPGAGL